MNFGKIRNTFYFYVNEFDWRSFWREKQEPLLKIITGSVFVFFFIFVIFLSPPKDFPLNHVVHIEEGLSLSSIIEILETENIIKYPSVFKFLAYVTFNQRDLIAGDYFFNEKQNIISVLLKLRDGKYGLRVESITFPEGVTVEEIAKLMKQKFDTFDDDFFIKLASNKEGYLFPDTYKFLPNIKPREVIINMEKNFKIQLEPLLVKIEESGKSLDAVIIMASILEKEARTKETKRMIADILWRRIEIGMPLQVDAVFPYIIGKNTFELTLADLKTDSPYNTYTNKGLPPGAISNPGLSSIEAALNPIPNEYLFYLSDRNGRMHYAKDFEEHKRNKRAYLN